MEQQQSFDKLTIYEEPANLLWGVVILLAASAGTLLLFNSFSGDTWMSGLKQVASLLCFVLAILGIKKVSDPLYQFELYTENGLLNVHITREDHDIKSIRYRLEDIEVLKFTPHYPPARGEALFDFTASYHLMYKSKAGTGFQRLLDLDKSSFTLKVQDIAKIIRYLKNHNPQIQVPKEQADYFNL